MADQDRPAPAHSSPFHSFFLVSNFSMTVRQCSAAKPGSIQSTAMAMNELCQSGQAIEYYVTALPAIDTLPQQYCHHHCHCQAGLFGLVRGHQTEDKQAGLFSLTTFSTFVGNEENFRQVRRKVFVHSCEFPKVLS